MKTILTISLLLITTLLVSDEYSEKCSKAIGYYTGVKKTLEEQNEKLSNVLGSTKYNLTQKVDIQEIISGNKKEIVNSQANINTYEKRLEEHKERIEDNKDNKSIKDVIASLEARVKALEAKQKE